MVEICCTAASWIGIAGKLRSITNPAGASGTALGSIGVGCADIKVMADATVG
jgi:hypothetical protein